MFVISYGPTPGGGPFGSFLNGEPLGTSPSAGNASTLSNAPYGAFRWIVIWPLESSVVMPLIVLGLPLENTRPLRSVAVYVLPPPETFGSAVPRPGIRAVPGVPAAWA